VGDLLLTRGSSVVLTIQALSQMVSSLVAIPWTLVDDPSNGTVGMNQANINRQAFLGANICEDI